MDKKNNAKKGLSILFIAIFTMMVAVMPSYAAVRESILIPLTSFNGSEYEKSFSIDSTKNGNSLNIWVSNVGTEDVHVIIYKDGERYTDYTIAAGKQVTHYVGGESDSADMLGDYRILVNNIDNYDVDIQVKARQYDR